MVVVNDSDKYTILIQCGIEYDRKQLCGTGTRSLDNKTLRIRNLQKNNKFYGKLASSGLEKHTSLDKETH